MLCTSASIFHISVTAADDETVKVALEALKEGFSEGCTTQVIEWRYVLHGKIRRFSSTKNRKIEEAYGKMSPNVTVGLCGDYYNRILVSCPLGTTQKKAAYQESR